MATETNDVPAVVDVKGQLFVSHESDDSSCDKCAAVNYHRLCAALPQCLVFVDGCPVFLWWEAVERK